MTTNKALIGGLRTTTLVVAVAVAFGSLSTGACGTSPGDTATLDVAARRAADEASRRARQNLTINSSDFGEATYDARTIMFGVPSTACPSGSACVNYAVEGLAADCTHGAGTCTFADLTAWAGTGTEPAPGSSTAATSCAQAACLSEMALCVSHRYIELSSEVDDTQLVTAVYTGQTVVAGSATITPTTAEQRTALLAEARGFARAAVSMAGEALRRGMNLAPAYTNYAVTCGAGTTGVLVSSLYTPAGATGQRTYAESLSMLLIEGAQVAEEAGERGLSVNGALAAAELSRERDPAEAMRKSWTDSVFSLGVGAQSIVGGVLGGTPTAPDTIPNAGLCATNDDRQAVKTVIDLLRTAGGSPARVFDLTNVSNLALFESTSNPGCVDTEGFSVACGDTASVCDRLAERLGDGSLAGNCFLRIKEDNGVTDTDITDARQRMRALAIAFPVSYSAVLPALQIGGGRTQATRYAATANPPEPVHPLYYATLARFGADDLSHDGAAFVDAPQTDWGPETDPVPVSPASAKRGSAGTLAYALSVAHAANAATSSPLPVGVTATLATFLASTGGDSGADRVEFCHDSIGTGLTALHEVRFRIFDGVSTAGRYSVVVGADGLRCAVQGSLNGAACDPDAYGANLLSAYPSFYTSAPSVSSSMHVSGSDGNGPDDWTEFYLTLPRDALNHSKGNILLFVVKKRGSTSEAGGYDPIAGFRVPFGLADQKNRCSVVSFYNSAWEEAGTALTPSTTRCGRPATSCAGTREDGPIPLENELSADGDDFESSWRHYLDEARRAASLADTLGEQVIEYGLANDMRVEDAEAELESTCGGASGVGALLSGDLSGVHGQACPTGPPAVVEGAPCSTVATESLSDSICRGGFCIADPAKVIARRAQTDPAFEGLSDCLSDDSVVAYVGLGDKNLCAWTWNDTLCGRDLGSCAPAAEGLPCTFGVNNGVCRNQVCLFEGKCPAVATGTGTTCGARPIGAVPVLVGSDTNTRMLGLFVAPTGGGENPTRAETLEACRGLRQLRTNVPSLADADRIALLNKVGAHFRLDGVAEYARGIGWEGRPFSNSAITFAGSALFETDDPRTSGAPTTAWPCVTPPSISANCGGLDGRTSDRHASLFCANIGAAYCGSNLITPPAPPPPPEPYADTAAEYRARMNERMARAVLALRAITDTGFTGISVPYQPTREAIARECDEDDEGWAVEGPEYPGRYTATFQAGSSTATYYNDSTPFASGGVGSGCIYDGFEWDPWPETDDVGQLIIPGTSYCVGSSASYASTTWVWPTYVLQAGGNSLGLPQGYVTDDGVCAYGAGAWPVMFRASAASASGNIGEVLRIWQNLDDNPSTDASAAPPDTIAFLLNRVRTADNIQLSDVLMQPFSGTEPGNNAAVYQNNVFGPLMSRDVLDALELVCEIEAGRGPVECADLPTPTATSLNDLASLETYLGCIADDMRDRASREVLSDVPLAALNGVEPGYEFSGTRGAAASRISQGLIGLRRYPREIADSIAGMQSDIRTLRLRLKGSAIHGELISLAETAAISSNVAACLKTAAGATSAKFFFGGAGETVAQCADSAIQIAVAVEKASLEAEDLAINTLIDWEDFSSGFRDRAAALKAAGDSLRAATTELRGGVADLESGRQTGLRSLARALLADSDAAGRHYPVNTVMRRRFNTAKVRYERQLQYAIEMAWMARRAVEQRLGMRLDEMRTPMSFVDAPATWADELCTFRGVDYTRIRAGGGGGPDNYADAYIGDYVENLGRVVESYQRDYPFHEASDTAVVSLRDDILGTRAFCDRPVPNLLAYSGALDRMVAPGTEARTAQLANTPDASTPAPVPDGGVPLPPPTYLWARTGCLDPASAACIAVTPYEIAASRRPWGETPADGPVFRVTFGPGLPSGTAPQLTAALVQEVWLPAGTYRLSWYSFSPEPGMSAVPTADIVATPDGGATVSDGGLRMTNGGPATVYRSHRFVRVAAAGTTPVSVQVRIQPNDPSTVDPRSFLVGGLMLEDVTTMFPGEALPASNGDFAVCATTTPGPYVGTVEPGVGRMQLCEDTTGTEFRRKWRHDCTRLCAGGWGSCTLGPTHCFWETSFSVTPESLERGGLFRRAGFAYGNFNYRMRSVTMNAVGTGVRSCADSSFPSTCYSDGSIRYSVEHTGPFTVTNHLGEYYDAPLFVGAIEHGRALAAERYVTNPISSADRAMIDQYRHTEMRGRPLAGNYTVRIWDEEGIQFSNIEDVQVILEYGYWTRQR